MRLTPVMLSTIYYVNNVRPKNGRRPTRQPFPFSTSLPVGLKDHVSGKGNKTQRFDVLVPSFNSRMRDLRWQVMDEDGVFFVSMIDETNFSKLPDVACLQEMSILFACLKKNEFAQSLCQKDIDSLKNCHNKYMHTQSQRKRQDKEGLLVPGEKKMTHKQLNLHLKKYPQPK